MEEKIKLHLGCGWRNFGKDWIHIDGGTYEHLDYDNIFDLKQFKDNSVDLIYASHLIAYFDRNEIIPILQEWRRVLKIGGILRLATPDFEELTFLYQEGKVQFENIAGPLYGRMVMGSETIYHKTSYDINSLYPLLRKIGFNDIKQYRWQDTEHANFDDHSQAYMCPNGDKENGTLISLNIECIKE